MTTILWRPEVNALTSPPSYVPRHVPRAVLGNDELAARMEQRNPLYTQTLVTSFFLDLADELGEQLINGNQVTLANLFTCHVTFSGRLDSPDDPLPPLAESLNVRLYPSKRLVETVSKNGQAERLAQEKKLPLIAKAKDSLWDLKDVLNPNGALQLTGDDLYFDRKQVGAGECVIEGTASGRTVQTRFLKVENSEIIFMPDIPSQPFPWNNEYKVSVSTRYSEHGTLRTTTYEWPLRTPVLIPNFGPGIEIGILTGAEDTAYVSVTGGTASGEATLRIQVILDLQADYLRFNLLDMTEGGLAGAVVNVTANGDITLPGFAGSTIMTLDIRVLEYAALKEMLRNTYNCRLVDVLVIT
ncbi:hypothetical protein [Candidatus Electronema sp. PJ]|uniref:hypothetical protein n=1 Tax=Candidatus Electronema sp. PJ TaxID=3401572 RepID=UPI003AA88250